MIATLFFDHRPVRSSLRILGVSAAVLLVLGALLLFVAYRASQHEPAFYRRALDVAPAKHAEAGDQLEKGIVDLHNALRRAGRWEARFTDQQINGWLASDLPEKFPHALPSDVSDPRVSIEDGWARIGCRYRGRRGSTILSLVLTAYVNERPNVVAIRIRNIRAGALPLPMMERWKRRIAQAALRAGLSLRWVKVDGQHVALVQVPVEHEQFKGRQLYLETIQLRDGAVYLAGRSEPAGRPAP